MGRERRTVGATKVGAANFVALSRFEVRAGFEHAVAAAFRDRPHLVDDDPGFVRLEVLRQTQNPAEYWLLTYWTDEPSFERWHRSHDRKAAHRGMPEGLRLVPGSAGLLRFEHVAS